MKKEVKNKRVYLKMIAMLFVLLSCLGIAAYLWRYLGPPSNTEAKIIAEKLGVSPSWVAIEDYLRSSIRPSMSQVEVHAVIQKIGSYWVAYSDPTDTPRFRYGENRQLAFRETIAFVEQNTAKALGKWTFWYDSNWKLLGFLKRDS